MVQRVTEFDFPPNYLLELVCISVHMGRLELKGENWDAFRANGAENWHFQS